LTKHQQSFFGAGLRLIYNNIIIKLAPPHSCLEVNALTTNPEDVVEYADATADIVISGRGLRLEMSVPTGMTQPIRLLPLFQSMADSFVGLALKDAETEAAKVSCKKGCGACCRQLVPISEVEAHQLRDLVDDMPEPRRSEIRARFGAERLRLQKSGLLEKLLMPERLRPEERTLFALDYFIQGIACPFLEEESCSIYNDRPIPCREYLVVSPAENCAKPSPDAVKCLKIPAEVSRAVRCFNPEQSPGRWVPLILAIEWANAHPDELPLDLGTELVHELLSRLVGKEKPGPAI
jgi:Fe-S-cluster containining protein